MFLMEPVEWVSLRDFRIDLEIGFWDFVLWEAWTDMECVVGT